MAQRDFSQVLIGYTAIWLIVFYYCTILFIAFIHFRRPPVKKVISTAMVLSIIIFLGITKWQRTHRDELIMTCLDVGHGQAILVQLPGGANILFDAGSMHRSNIGTRIVSPFLDYSGTNKIDSIIISHNDVDHINGIPEIAEHCKLGGVYADDTFLEDMETGPDGTAKFLETLLNKNGLEIKSLKELNLNSAAKVKILWPSEKAAYYKQLKDNDKSAVSLIEFAGKKVLLCSDIEKFAQVELLRIYPDLKADVVVVPHHGSRKTTEQYFIENLDAGILICSCSQRDYERQQTTKIENKAKSFYTARDGAITICIDKDGMIR